MTQIEAVVKLVAIHSSTCFDFGGQSVLVPLTMTGESNGQHSSVPLINQLQQSIYANCYARQVAFARQEGKFLAAALPAPSKAAPKDLTDELSLANSSRDYREGDWQVVKVLPGGKVIAQKRNAERCCWPGEYVSESGPGMPPVVGSRITIYFRREGRHVQSGFYFAYGETTDGTTSPYEIVRYYFNLASQNAPMLVEHLTKSLNDFSIPFRLKCGNHTTAYERIDTAVLYVRAQYYRIAAEIIAELTRHRQIIVQNENPILTRRLARGLAFAEEPSTGESFGMHRCRLIAAALWEAFGDGRNSTADKMASVRSYFEENRLCLEQPYLREGSTGYYEFPSFE